MYNAKQILEMLSKTVYHYTSQTNVLEILQDNKFYLTASISAQSDDSFRGKKDKYFFMSVTRSRLGSYKDDCCLVLDGDTLGQNNYAKAVDYWGREFRKIQPTKNEMEDRIFSSSRVILNASKHIKEIHIFIRNDYTLPLYDIQKLTNQLNLPLYIYDNEKSYILLDKRKAIPYEATNQNYTPSKANINSKDFVHPHILALKELVEKDSEQELSKEARDLYYNIYNSSDYKSPKRLFL